MLTTGLFQFSAFATTISAGARTSNGKPSNALLKPRRWPLLQLVATNGLSHHIADLSPDETESFFKVGLLTAPLRRRL